MRVAETDRRVRLGITRHFATHGYAPEARDIAARLDLTSAAVETAFERLAEDDQVILCNNRHKLRAAHPYLAVPTAYWIESGKTGWWANCAFCALGVAVIAGGPARIHTRLGAMNEPVTLATRDRWISDETMCLHIPLPVRQWHDDIAYTCSHVHLFRDAAQIDAWAKSRSLPRGRHVTLVDAWRLARAWYANYLDDDWTPHTSSTLNRLFGSCDLTGEFWTLNEMEHGP